MKIKNLRLYHIWQGMMQRCYNSNNHNYHNYGGRNINVCDIWHTYTNFENDMYESYCQHVEEYGEKDTTIDRINVDGNYYKGNCRWATNKEQANNKRGTIKTPIGESLFEYCKNNNLNYNTISGRIKRGWTLEKALNIPIKSRSDESLKDRCKKLGINYNTVQGRLKSGYTIEEALTVDKKAFTHKYFLPTGETLKDYCERNNINCESVRKRLRRGWTLERAINEPFKKLKMNQKEQN